MQHPPEDEWSVRYYSSRQRRSGNAHVLADQRAHYMNTEQSTSDQFVDAPLLFIPASCVVRARNRSVETASRSFSSFPSFTSIVCADIFSHRDRSSRTTDDASSIDSEE